MIDVLLGVGGGQGTISESLWQYIGTNRMVQISGVRKVSFEVPDSRGSKESRTSTTTFFGFFGYIMKIPILMFLDHPKVQTIWTI